MKTTQELLNLIELKQIGETTFEGFSQTIGSSTVFGGQVLAQALNAAYRAVPKERICHSLHSYFILPGNLDKPIRFKVQKVRDGGSFTTRYVTAEQDEKPIFVLACSFQKKEEGYEFQTKMPEVPGPETLLSWEEIHNRDKGILPKSFSEFLGLERPITFKPAIINNPLEKMDLPPFQNVWFRFNKIENEISLQHFQQVLCYASDYNILVTALQPHASKAHFGNMQMASLDHAMWFQRKPESFTDWFLYSIEVSGTSNSRGLTTGKIFDRKG